MKLKHFVIIAAALAGIATVAAAVAVFVNRYLGGGVKSMGYIECNCSEDEE